MDFNPWLFPFPRGDPFTAAFGESAWNEFVGRIINTRTYFSLRCGSLNIDEATFYGDSGIDDGWIMHMAKSLDDVHFILAGNKNGSCPRATAEAAREFVRHCERCIREIQGLDTVKRLFMQSQ